ncbi:MAG: succinylglutamate desuccinylase/aspartoacylase family protein [Gemmatimonadota bacterium]
MTPEAARSQQPERDAAEPLRRVIGQVVGDRRGPLTIGIGGIHGNEPSGVQALERVFRTLEEHRLPRTPGTPGTPLRGEFVGLAGNLAALARGRRYIDKDLNRQWMPEFVKRLRAAAPRRLTGPEDQEQSDLLAELEAALSRAQDEVFIIDLHTTSSQSGPFVTIGDTLRNREFAMNFPVPMVLGLEEHLGGTLLQYLDNLGHVTLGFEAGQHEDPESVDRAEATVWTALVAAGNLELGDLAEVDRCQQILARTGRGLPRVLYVRHRHEVSPGSDFRMEPGFANFQPVKRGQLLAWDRDGEIRSQRPGRILMPLYQELGEDGFFLATEFRPIRLKLSALMRRLRLDAIAHWLPGVERHSTSTFMNSETAYLSEPVKI